MRISFMLYENLSANANVSTLSFSIACVFTQPAIIVLCVKGSVNTSQLMPQVFMPKTKCFQVKYRAFCEFYWTIAVNGGYTGHLWPGIFTTSISKMYLSNLLCCIKLNFGIFNFPDHYRIFHCFHGNKVNLTFKNDFQGIQ
jgi:hypothetical protein